MWWRWCDWYKNGNKDKIIWNEREWIVEYINTWMKDGLIIWIERGDSKRVEWSIELKECLMRWLLSVLMNIWYDWYCLLNEWWVYNRIRVIESSESRDWMNTMK